MDAFGLRFGFVYLSRELQAASHPRAIGWLSVQDPYAMRNNEVHLRHDALGPQRTRLSTLRRYLRARRVG